MRQPRSSETATASSAWLRRAKSTRSQIGIPRAPGGADEVGDLGPPSAGALPEPLEPAPADPPPVDDPAADVPALEPLLDGPEDGELSPLVGDRIRFSVDEERSLVEGVEDEGSFGVEVPVDGKGSPETVS